MFKFNIVEWDKQKTRDPLFDLIMSKMSDPQDHNSFLRHQDATSLVLTNGTEQAIGGTSLVKRELSHLQEDIRRLIPTGTSYRGYVWECSTIYFVPSSDITAGSLSSISCSRTFYRSLYEGLVEFGKQKEVGFIIVKLAAEEYLPTKNLGLWPYIIQFLPREFPDDLFYGILPLKGCFYEMYQKFWEESDQCGAPEGENSLDVLVK